MITGIPEPSVAPSPKCALVAKFCPLWWYNKCYIMYFLLFLSLQVSRDQEEVMLPVSADHAEVEGQLQVGHHSVGVRSTQA